MRPCPGGAGVWPRPISRRNELSIRSSPTHPLVTSLCAGRPRRCANAGAETPVPVRWVAVKVDQYEYWASAAGQQLRRGINSGQTIRRQHLDQAFDEVGFGDVRMTLFFLAEQEFIADEGHDSDQLVRVIGPDAESAGLSKRGFEGLL